MKKYFYLTSFVIAILILTSCSPATPAPAATISVVDVQNTAIALAWSALTQTQAAIQAAATETPVPPTPTLTFTPQPTFTLLAVATQAQLTSTPSINPCNEPPPAKTKGKIVSIRFVNKSGSRVNLSFGMQRENPEKECGTYTFVISQSDELVVNVLAGCYWAYGWVENPPSTAKNINELCVTDTTKTTAIWITKEVINFH